MTQPKIEQKERLPFFEVAFIIFLLAIYLLPSVSLSTTLILLVLFAYCGYLVLMDHKMFMVILKPMFFIVILALFYALLTDASSISQDVSNRDFKRFVSKVYQYFTLYFPAILFIRINKKASSKQKKCIALVGLVFVVYIIITSWLFFIENPDAAREWSEIEEYSTLNIANYYFVYAVPIIVSVATIVLVRSRGFSQILSLAFIIVGILFLVRSQYVLSILIAVFGVLLQFYRNLRSSSAKVIYLLLAMMFAIFLPEILNYTIMVVDSSDVATRLSEIYDFLVGKGTGGYNLNGRLTLYGDTILAFFDSPIWGNRRLDFDGHATFLTVLSDTGILGGIPFYALLITIYKYIKKAIGPLKKQFNVIIIMFVIMGLTNPIHASLPLGMVTWFLGPLMIEIILGDNVKNEEAVEA